jgi:hypothetical protein
VSFFEDDEPTTVQRAPRARRSTPPRRPGGGSGGGRGPRGGDVDAQTLRTRRLAAGGIGLLLLIILVLLFNACQNSRAKNALRDYNQAATELVSQSDSTVGQQLFETLGQGSSQSPEDLQTTVSGLRAEAQTQLRRAKDLSTPGDLSQAQQSLLIALELREDGLDYIADRIGAALGNEGDQADEAITQIAGQMQAFLASDVLIRSRVSTSIRDVLADKDVVADPASTEGFLPNYDWLQPDFVADQLGTRLTGGGGSGGGGGGGQQEEDRPAGLYGTSLEGTTIGGVALEPGDEGSNRVPLAEGRSIEVQFTNGGELDESDIPVSVELQGSSRPIEGRTSVDAVAQGETATATVRLNSAPAAGEVYTVTVQVGEVPGEENTDNNRSTYNVLFE